MSSILGRLLNYLLVPFYTRVFVPAEYGVVSEFYAYVTFLIIVYTFGMETTYFQFSSRAEKPEKVYHNSLLTVGGISVFISTILILFHNSIAGWLGYAGNAEYIVWFALILAFDALTAIPFARLRQLGQAKKFAGLRLLNIFLNIIFNLFFIAWLPELAADKDSIWASVYNENTGVGYVFLSNLLASGITFLLLIPLYKGMPFKGDKQLIRTMLVYAFPLLIAGFAGMINETLDRAILKYLVTDKKSALEQLGIYSACYKLSILMTLFVQTFRYASEPFFFAEQQKENSRELYARVMNYFVLGCCIIMAGVLCYLDIVKLFIGSQYHSGLHVVPILLLANLFLGIYLNLSIWYKLTGQTQFGAWLSVFGASVTITFNLWLIPRLGYTGAAWATLACYSSMMILSYLKGQQIFKVPYQNGKLLVLILAALITWKLAELLKEAAGSHEAVAFIINSVLMMIYAWFGWRWIHEGKMNFNFRKPLNT